MTSLAEIKAAAEAATPGPWEEMDEGEGFIIAGATPEDGIYPHPLQNGSGCFFEPDAAFIALSREAVPWLVERVEELAEEVRGVTDLAERLAGGGEYVAIGKARAALARLEGEQGSGKAEAQARALQRLTTDDSKNEPPDLRIDDGMDV